jgi:hypothetical protein
MDARLFGAAQPTRDAASAEVHGARLRRDRRDSFAYLHGASTAPGLRCLGDTSSATPSCYILSAGEVGEGDGVAEVAELVVVLAAAGDQAQFCSVGGVAVDRPGGEFVFLVALYAVGDEHGG